MFKMKAFHSYDFTQIFCMVSCFYRISVKFYLSFM